MMWSKVIALQCQRCKSEFRIREAALCRRSGRFCSWACYAADQVLSRTPMAVRFWSRVRKTDGCWLWTGQRDDDGYGLLGRGGYGGGTVRVHRYSWELHNGKPVPDGMQVCHTCDNPTCVNPDHLFVGTSKDNARDCVAKGRRATRLTEAQVIEIRRRIAAGEASQRQVARELGLAQTTIARIVHRRRWAHL
jgi:hypothetical protein